jgi:gamma-glutamylcyclotransferase (GGCT)/AIG2-like uncharacterized protein YtfP
MDKERPSRMAQKFKEAAEQGWEPDAIIAPEPFRAEYYFFYGTLMDPKTLARVLKLRHSPELVPARITGYSCKLWGPYPALVDGPCGNNVHGMAYMVQSPAEQQHLEIYETHHYKDRACMIKLKDGKNGEKVVLGRTFVWNEDKSKLKEGIFDLQDWQKKNSEK